MPRSGPDSRSSAKPIAVTTGSREANVQPTSGSRRPRWFVAIGPHASAASSSCRPRWTKPRGSRPVARCRKGSSRSRTSSPARTASIVMRTSQPKPGASGKQAFRAAAESARWPESGSRASNPLNSRINSRAPRFAIPKPPPSRCSKAATARSASSSSRAAGLPRRSASQRSSAPGPASRSARLRACPLPSRGRRTTLAPAPSAAAAVPSREPSSATTTSASGSSARKAVTVSAIDRSSSRAATRTVSLSATRAGDRERRQGLVGGFLEAVLGGRRAAEQQHEREPALGLVQVVHAGEPGASERVYRRVGRDRRLHAYGGHAVRAEAFVEPEQEAARRPALRRRGAGHDHAVHRLPAVAAALLDELVGERIPERSVAAGHELVPELPPEGSEPGLAVVPLEVARRRRGELLLDSGHVERHLQRAEPHLRRAGVGECSVDRGAEPVVDRSGEQHRDPLAAQAVTHEDGIRLVDVELRRALLTLRELRGLGRLVELGLELRHALLEQAPLRAVDEPAVGDPDPDEDPDHQREEDGGQRGDVVAEVEHQRSAPVWHRAYRRLSARRGSERLTRSQAPSTVSVAFVFPSCAGSSRSSASMWSSTKSIRKSSPGRTSRIVIAPAASGPRRNALAMPPVCGPATSCHRAPGARPRRSGRTAWMPGHQSARFEGSATKRQTSSLGASSSRVATTRGTCDHPIPSRSRSRWTTRSMKCRRPGEARIATTTAARPAAMNAISGQSPTSRLARRETPFASTRISPTFSLVTKVEDIPARSRSRNSIRLKWVPTATISSAPFSYASRSARSSLMPWAATVWNLTPNSSRRSAPGAAPLRYACTISSAPLRSVLSDTESMSPTITSGFRPA